MTEEYREIAKELAPYMKDFLKETVAEATTKCVGDECKKIRSEYDELLKTAKKLEKGEEVKPDKLDEVLKRMVELEEKLAADKEAPAPPAAAKEEVVDEDCPNCGIKKGKKPKYVGHCSGEGKGVKFSDFEHELEWEYCPNCGSEIVWPDDDEDEEE